jgi:hypothetical protein
MRDDDRLRLSDIMALRGMYELEGEEMTGGRGKLHNEGLLNVYSSPNIMVMKTRRMR